MDEVKRHHLSTCRVIWALSLKNIPYEYVTKDLTDKTPFLLHQNLSMIVHGGKSIADSSVILEYIDETWPQNPLLPLDRLDKATARSWIRFIDDKRAVVPRMFCSGGNEQMKAKQESLEMLRILEEEGIGEEKFFGGEKIGMVDLALGEFVEWLGVFEEVIGEKVMESGSFPRLEAWSRAFMEVPAIRENRADRDRMVENFKRHRVRLLHPSSTDLDLKGFSELFRCVSELVSCLIRIL